MLLLRLCYTSCSICAREQAEGSAGTSFAALSTSIEGALMPQSVFDHSRERSLLVWEAQVDLKLCQYSSHEAQIGRTDTKGRVDESGYALRLRDALKRFDI